MKQAYLWQSFAMGAQVTTVCSQKIGDIYVFLEHFADTDHVTWGCPYTIGYGLRGRARYGWRIWYNAATMEEAMGLYMQSTAEAGSLPWHKRREHTLCMCGLAMACVLSIGLLVHAAVATW